jgi:hypothetical protein
MHQRAFNLLRQATNIAGWVFLVVAALDALGWVMSYPTARGIRDFGVEAARVCYYAVLSIPPFLAASALLRFVCRRPDRTTARYTYWGIFGFILLTWFCAYGELFKPTKGRDIFLGGGCVRANEGSAADAGLRVCVRQGQQPGTADFVRSASITVHCRQYQ